MHGLAQLSDLSGTLDLNAPLLGQLRIDVEPGWRRMTVTHQVEGVSVSLPFVRVAWPEPVPKAAHQGPTAAGQLGEFESERDKLFVALEAAAAAPQPEDEIAVLRRLFLLARRIDLSKKEVNRLVDRVLALVQAGHQSEDVIGCAAAAAPMALSKALQEDRLGHLGLAGQALLDAPASAQVRIGLVTSLVALWLRLGRAADATAAIDALSQIPLTAEQTLSVAGLRADVQFAAGDLKGGADLLVDAYEKASGASAAARIPVLVQLVAQWPPDHEGLDRWVGQLEQNAKALGEPQRSLAILSAAVACAQTKHFDRKNQLMALVAPREDLLGASPVFVAMFALLDDKPAHAAASG
jgi:hypothetical protein